MPYKIVIVYFTVISIVSIIVACYDKIASKKFPRDRTPEATLLLLAALGGSAAMYITMLLIRHKTQHPKFMVGIPFIAALQAAAVICAHIFFFTTTTNI